MSKDEYPINLIYDGIAEMLIEKGNVKYVTCTDFIESQAVVDYGGYRYFILKHLGEVVTISRYIIVSTCDERSATNEQEPDN